MTKTWIEKQTAETPLRFGTAGLRGICGEGAGQINSATLGAASLGLADHLLQQETQPLVLIAYDSRIDSRRFAEETACVLAAKGVRVQIFRELTPVPVLSFAIRKLRASAGIMITASHNPKEYNGYKVYHRSGRQILEAEADEILHQIEAADRTELERIQLDFAGLSPQQCSYVAETVFQDYLAEVERALHLTPEHRLNVIYTPLNGAGKRAVTALLRTAGFTYQIVSEQEDSDGNFPTCPYPNPERKEVFALAEKYGRIGRADLLLATDPDCDRVGVMVWDKGEYRLLSGNELGILLFHYICTHTADCSGRRLYTSVVSAPLVDRIAEHFQVQVKRVPVGFKFIGELIERAPQAFLFGFEESNGYLAGNYARDKDGAAAAALTCRMAAHYKAQGKNLFDVLQEIYETYGYELDRTETLEITNAEEREVILQKLTEAGSFAESKDALCSEFPLHDIVQLCPTDGVQVIVRPSGTEPKIKFYYTASGNSRQVCEEKYAQAKRMMKQMMQDE